MRIEAGVWHRLGTVSQGFTTVGTWDLATRKLKFPYFAIINDATSSKNVNGFWTSSGAGDINFLLTFLTSLNIYLTEVRHRKCFPPGLSCQGFSVNAYPLL